MWYQYLLVAVCALAWWQDPPRLDGPVSLANIVKSVTPIQRAAVVLLCNAAILSAWFAVSGNNDNMALNLSVDIISAYIIGREPAGKQQGWLVMTYCFQIGAHVSALTESMRGIDIPIIQPSYWETLHYAFLVQLMILFSWGETHGGRIAIACNRAWLAVRPHAPRNKVGQS